MIFLIVEKGVSAVSFVSLLVSQTVVPGSCLFVPQVVLKSKNGPL